MKLKKWIAKTEWESQVALELSPLDIVVINIITSDENVSLLLMNTDQGNQS